MTAPDPAGDVGRRRTALRLLPDIPPDQEHGRQVVELEIVIPVLNEEERIGNTVAEIFRHLVDVPFSTRLIVVDNGCIDYTAEIVDAAPVGIDVELISCRLRGKGAAVRAGIRHSSSATVAYCDADLSTPPKAIAEAYALIAQGWQAVIGSRRCEGASYELDQSLVRRIGSRAFNLAAAGVVGNMSDTQCGFKMMNGQLARRVFDAMQLNGFAFDVELIARLIGDGAQMTELPIHWTNDEDSKFNVVSDGVRAFRDLLHVRRVLQSSPEVRSA